MNTLRNALRSEDITLTAELALSPRQSSANIVQQAKILAEATDAIQIPDHRFARPHVSNVAVAALLLQNGLQPIVHMNCRDRNRVALQSDILGARALGANNLLLLRGTSFSEQHTPRSTGVFDVGAIDLLATAASIRDETVFALAAPNGAPKLYLGAVATVFDPASSWEPEKLTSKADAGAQFIQLQVCMDPGVLHAYMARIVAAKLTWRLQFLGSIAVFGSAEEARQLREERPDSIIPASVVKRLEEATDPASEGIVIAAELLREIAAIPGIAGITLATMADPASIPAAIRESGIRSDKNRG